MNQLVGKPKRTRGFTLIELLAAIAIISVLMAILLPSMSGAQQRSRDTKCQANVKEIAHATLRYVTGYGDFFPVAADCSGGDGCYFWNGHQYFGWNGRMLNQNGNVWARPINGELGLELSPPGPSGAKIAECPSDGGAIGETGVQDRLFEVYGTSYALNPILCQGRFADWRYRSNDLNLSHVFDASRKVLAFDHIAFGLTYDAYWTAIRPGWHDRTRPAAVVSFVDGHADYVAGKGQLYEWQWYPEATGPQFVRDLSTKVDWQVFPECQ